MAVSTPQVASREPFSPPTGEGTDDAVSAVLAWLPLLYKPQRLRQISSRDSLAPSSCAAGGLRHLAGMPPAYGLYSAMVPCVIAALFGSSRVMVTGPANAISLTVLAIMAPLAAPESPRYVELVITLAFMVGCWQLLLALVKAGRLIDYVSHTVIVGFTAGAAVLIVNSQIRNFSASTFRVAPRWHKPSLRSQLICPTVQPGGHCDGVPDAACRCALAAAQSHRPGHAGGRRRRQPVAAFARWVEPNLCCARSTHCPAPFRRYRRLT